MKLLTNLLLFFVVFLPTSCAVGLAAELFVGPVPQPRIAYQLEVFATRVLPLLLPALLAVPLLHFGARPLGARLTPAQARAWLVGVTPLALLAFHLALVGSAYLSFPLLALFLLPGAAYGALFSVPDSSRRR